MPDPIFGVWLAIQRSVLDVDALVLFVEVEVTDGSCLVCQSVIDADGLEKRWYDDCNSQSSVLQMIRSRE